MCFLEEAANVFEETRGNGGLQDKERLCEIRL